jgi:hypothetical protein
MEVNSPPGGTLSPCAVTTDSPATTEAQRTVTELRSQILQAVFEMSSSARPPETWRTFGTRKSVRRLAVDPTDVVASLLTKFTHDELIEARAAHQGATGQLRLSPIFGNTFTSFVIRSVQGEPFDAVSERGVLSADRPEWQIAAADKAVRNSQFETPYVLASTDAELALYHRLKVLCGPLDGVQKITGKQVRELFAARAKVPELRKYKLTIPAWQIGELVSTPSAIHLQTIQYIKSIRAAFNFDPATIFDVWVPKVTELRAINRAHAFADYALTREAVQKSLQKSRLTPADALLELQRRKPATYAAARAALETIVKESEKFPRVADVKNAFEKLEQVFKSTVITPLETTAEGATALENWHGDISADLARDWFANLPVVVAARRIMEGQFPNREQEAGDEALNRKLKYIGGFVKLARTKFPK